MAYCAYCGQPLQASARFCSECGAAVTTDTDTQSATASASREPTSPTSPQPIRFDRKAWLITGGICAAMIYTVAILFALTIIGLPEALALFVVARACSRSAYSNAGRVGKCAGPVMRPRCADTARRRRPQLDERRPSHGATSHSDHWDLDP